VLPIWGGQGADEEVGVSRNWKRLILIGLAVPNVLSGCWAVFAPAD